MKRGVKNGVYPFGKSSSEDYFLPFNVSWFSVDNLGTERIKIIIGMFDDQKMSEYFHSLPSPCEVEAVEVGGEQKHGAVIRVAPGRSFSPPESFSRMDWVFVRSNGSQTHAAAFQ